jgi:hypothetical protein
MIQLLILQTPPSPTYLIRLRTKLRYAVDEVQLHLIPDKAGHFKSCVINRMDAYVNVNVKVSFLYV